MTIYKYLNVDRVQALENATLRATQASALNDPFELRPVFQSMFRMSDLDQAFDQQSSDEALADAVLAELPEFVRAQLTRGQVLAFVQSEACQRQTREARRTFRGQVASMLPDLSGHARQQLYETLSKRVGIVSFTVDPLSRLMWAHYASDHKGFVIGFDESNPFFDRRRSAGDEFFHLRPVKYVAASQAFETLSDMDGTDVLCAKQSDWAYEREVRLLVPVDPEGSPTSDEPIHLIEFPRASVRCVILGHRASNHLEQDLRAILTRIPEYASVELMRASPVFSTREMQLDPI